MRSIAAAALPLILCAGLAGAQDIGTLAALGEKGACSVSDLASMAPAIAAVFPTDTGLPARLEAELARLDAGAPLTTARAAAVAARSLRVRTSMFFALIPIRRYAFRAMVADGVFAPGSSGGDAMNGIELMEFVSSLERAYGRIR